MERRENQRVMLTKRLIQESLTELLKTEGIHKISVRALCEGAGINRSTFYRYYGSQYDVLTEMEEEVLQDVAYLLRQDPVSSDREKLEAICAYFERHMDSVRVLVGNNVDPEFPRKLFGMPLVREMIFERMGPDVDEEMQRCGSGRLYLSSRQATPGGVGAKSAGSVSSWRGKLRPLPCPSASP